MGTSYKLQRAETKDHGFSSPALSMAAAIGGLLAFGGLICLGMVFPAILSGGSVKGEFFAAGVGVTVLGGSLFVISQMMFRKAKREFLKKRKEMYKSGKRFSGRVVGVNKHVRHVKYMKDTFDETLWSFKIEYNDGGEIRTVTSDKYLNDISQVLKSDKVTVVILGDGTAVFKNYCLRNNENDPCIKLETEETEQDAEI